MGFKNKKRREIIPEKCNLMMAYTWMGWMDSKAFMRSSYDNRNKVYKSQNH